MNKRYIIIVAIVIVVIAISQCNQNKNTPAASSSKIDTTGFIIPDTSKIPRDKFGDMVRYGRELLVNTALYIGPKGTAGNFTGNKMNCSNCHQDGGTKPFSFNLVMSHDRYPQYRPREAKVLTLAERVNNCVMRPHNGKALPLDSKEMIGF